MAESSSAAPPPKPVVVRVKRKPFQSPVDAFWLEINERPLKRPLLDFGNLSISESAQKVDFRNKKVLMRHVETTSSSEVTFDIVQSFMDPGSGGASKSKSKSKVEERKHFFKKDNKQDQLLLKAKQEKESLAKDARFKQIWKSRKGNEREEEEKELQELCHFYDIVRVDNEENSKKVQQEDISLEDQRLLSSYLPLLRELIPNAAEEIEADMHAHSKQGRLLPSYLPLLREFVPNAAEVIEAVMHADSKQEDYVYDLYTVKDEEDINLDDSSFSYPLVQVDDDEDYYDGPDNSDYESDDSNAENNPLNDYPDEISEEEEEEDEASECESEEINEEEHGSDSDEPSEEDLEHKGFSEDEDDDADALSDEDFDNYDGEGNCDEDVDEDWMWSHR